MPEESWEKNLDPGPDYRVEESTLRLHAIPGNLLNLNGQTLKQNYDGVRDSEKNIRFEEVLQKVREFYFSRKGVALLVVSVILSAITSVLSPEGIFFWNIVLFILVWVKFELSAKSPVRAEWQDIEEEFDTL
jgi:hypothetical protein